MDEKTTLTGLVENIVFRNDDNGWTVLELDTGDTLETVVGSFHTVQVGEQLTVQGTYTEHPHFGRQFKATAFESRLPTDETAILRYLASGAVRGIGPSTAMKIVDRFGAESLRILEEEPEELAKIKGISLARARDMGQSFCAQFGLREVVMTFATYGLTANEAMRAYKRFGSSTLLRVKANPYLLCTSGLYIGFERADMLGQGLGMQVDDQNRVDAGVLYVLRHNTGNGHTCLPRDKVIPAAAQLLGVPTETTEAAVERLLLSFELREETLHDRPFLYLQKYYESERFIANRVGLMNMACPISETDLELRIDAMEHNFHITYEEQQRHAMVAAIAGGTLILTGGPGTGKTTAVKGILEIFERKGIDVILECSGNVAVLDDCVDALAKQGKLILISLYGKKYTNFDVDAFVFKEAEMRTVMFHDTLDTIKAVADGVDLSPLITKHLKFDEAAEFMMKLINEKSKENIKVMIDFD